MTIGKSLTALGGGGLKPEIRVTARAGALLNLHYKDSSIILQSYQLGAKETQHTFVVGVSETAYVAEDATNNASVEVLVDAVAQYSVEISYILWLYKDGDEFPDVTGRFSVNKVTTGVSGTPYLTKSDTYMTVYTPKYSDCSLVMANTIDVSNYNSLYIEYTCSITHDGCYADSIIEAGVIKKPSPALIDISSSATLKGIVGWIANFWDGYFRVHKIWLE